MQTVTDLFAKYNGVKEYNGIVATIQNWYYGYLYKASWCATSMSYFMNELGLLDQIGGKNENVYEMMRAAEKAKKGGEFYYRDNIPSGRTLPRGTILFMLYSDSPMTPTSSKHVTSLSNDTIWKGSGAIKCFGGNQSDMICEKQYYQANVYAAFIPNYNKKESSDLKRGSKGDNVVELQENLNSLGYTDNDGNALERDGSFGRRTEEAVKKLQKENGLYVDGVVGPITKAKISELLKKKPTTGIKIKALTDVNVRSGPAKTYPVIGVLKENQNATYTKESGLWLYSPEKSGWINCNYVTTDV